MRTNSFGPGANSPEKWAAVFVRINREITDGLAVMCMSDLPDDHKVSWYVWIEDHRYSYRSRNDWRIKWSFDALAVPVGRDAKVTTMTLGEIRAKIKEASDANA